MTTKSDVFAALAGRGQFTVKSEAEQPSQLRLLGSIPQNKVATTNWQVVIHYLLSRAEAAPWKVDISKHYFLRGGKTWFGWRLIFQAQNVQEHYADIVKTVTATPRASRVQVDEFPLDAPPNRNSKGNIGTFGSVPTGPFAVRRG